MPAERSFVVQETRHVPADGIVLGLLAMVPIAAGGIAPWLFPTPLASTAPLTTIWSAVIVAFLAGVRRGLSFRSPRGPSVAQLATMLWLFALAIAASALGSSRVATVALIAAFLSLAIFDTQAAYQGDAPLYFSRLRPLQMVVPVLGLALLFGFQVSH